jgi:predicted CXXCH cytochrome family protein
MRHLAKKVIGLTGIAVLALASTSYAQKTAVVKGGPHDLSTGSGVTNNATATIDSQTCVFCHAPHGGGTATPLWNRGTPSGSGYSLYKSSTSATTETVLSVTGGPSGACLSCHDGSIAMDVLTVLNGAAFPAQVAFAKAGTSKATYGNITSGTNNQMTGGLPFLGTDLSNDHPVGITYNTAYSTLSKSGQYVQATNPSGQLIVVGTQSLPLFGTTTLNATVECASCHSSHDNHLGNFLRVANTGSQMCLSCHIK